MATIERGIVIIPWTESEPLDFVSFAIFIVFIAQELYLPFMPSSKKMTNRHFNQGALPALLPFFIADYDLSYTAAASIVFAANVASSIIQPIFGYAADKFSKFKALTAIKNDKNKGSKSQFEEENWWAFIRLTIVIIGRSIIFYGLNTFIPIYWINHLHH